MLERTIQRTCGVFSSREGAQAGDPLSPIFFIIAVEGLDSMMRISSHNNWIRGFKVGNRANEVMEITHLQYADDTVVFCEANHEQICYLRVILVFEACSRLRQESAFGSSVFGRSGSSVLIRFFQYRLINGLFCCLENGLLFN